MKARVRQRCSQSGFSLLEAVVALTIVATLGLVIFDWIRQSLDGASRIRAEHARVELQLNAQALVASVNPAFEPQGERSFGGLTVRWSSRRMDGPSPLFGMTFGAGQVAGGWQVGLYELAVQASMDTPTGDAGAPATVAFKTLRTGVIQNAPGKAVLR